MSGLGLIKCAAAASWMIGATPLAVSGSLSKADAPPSGPAQNSPSPKF